MNKSGNEISIEGLKSLSVGALSKDPFANSGPIYLQRDGFRLFFMGDILLGADSVTVEYKICDTDHEGVVFKCHPQDERVLKGKKIMDIKEVFEKQQAEKDGAHHWKERAEKAEAKFHRILQDMMMIVSQEGRDYGMGEKDALAFRERRILSLANESLSAFKDELYKNDSRVLPTLKKE